MKSLKSSVEEVGEVVTQIFHFSGGNKRTFSGLITSTIRQGEFTKIRRIDGSYVMINPKNVDIVEVFNEKDTTPVR